MDVQVEKRAKSGQKKPSYTALRVRREIRRQLSDYLDAANKKDFGRRVRADEILSLALSLITPQHLQQLQEAALSNSDRLERDFRAYTAEHGAISRDEYLGKRLNGEIVASQKSITPLTT